MKRDEMGYVLKKHTVTAVLLATLAACSSGSGETQSPDEFAILPVKPLSEPKDVQPLPEPTPGGANLTDATPIEDLTQTLGGRSAVVDGTVDTALLAQINGPRSVPDQRANSNKSVIKFGQAIPLQDLVRLFNRRGQALIDPYAELERFNQARASKALASN